MSESDTIYGVCPARGWCGFVGLIVDSMASITGGSAILEKHREAIERDGPRMVTQAVGKNTFYGGSVKPDRDDKQSSSPNSYFQTGYKSLMDLAIRRILVVVATPEV